MSEEKDKCKSCEYESESSGEHCNCCEGYDRWKENGYLKDDRIKSLESRLKEAEAELEKAWNVTLYATETELLKRQTEKIQSLEQRLSQAEAERDKAKKQALENGYFICKQRNVISHLMDVAGKMAEELKEVCKYVKAPCNMDTTDLQRLAMWKQNLFALAEWDGIKDGGK
jgi:chromosome segregation ATPase